MGWDSSPLGTDCRSPASDWRSCLRVWRAYRVLIHLLHVSGGCEIPTHRPLRFATAVKRQIVGAFGTYKQARLPST